MSQFWQLRVSNANEFYKKWSAKFKCQTLEDYYEGNQWKGRRDYITVNYNPYTLNMVYSTIKNKQANLLFQKPTFNLEPTPGSTSTWDADIASQATEIKAACLNTLVGRKNARFVPNVKLSALDSYFRFGVMEVGYAADWRNPQKEDPLLADYGKDDYLDTDKKVRVINQNDLPENERIFFKRIHAKRFRVSVSDASELNDHEWCGYYQFYPTKLLRNTKGIKFPSDYTADSITYSAEYNVSSLTGADSYKPEFLQLLHEGTITKCWHIFDMVEKKRKLLIDGTFDTLWEKDCDRLPLLDIRWDLRLEGFYPIPPVFQWLSSQDEINESREQMRSFRRRFSRKYWYIENNLDELELEKMVSGPDGVCIKVKSPESIGEIPNSPINPSNEESLGMSKDDFNIVSGTSAEARGQNADRETATAAKITAAKASVRESADQMDFSVWICDIAQETLVCAKENLSTGLWARFASNPDLQTEVLQDLQANGPIYQYITSQQIDDGYDFTISIDAMNQTPASLAQEEQSFVSFVAMLNQFPQLAMSPVLIRKAAMVTGMKDEKVIQQMQHVAILSMAAKAAQQAATQGQTLSQAMSPGTMPGANNTGKSQVAQMASPTAEETQTQLEQQVQ